ncbi:MAG TPA: hypothetical protein VNE21_01015 [Mycobacteriales bacterium]|nr:hypothetical protein [Mycobacteriales bacterium]
MRFSKRAILIPLALPLAMIALIAADASPAAAAKPSKAGGLTTTGNDISYPQCGGGFPSGQAFGLVGVNDGLANNLNPCLGEDGGGPATSELSWAWSSTGKSAPGVQPQAGLYVNTADPGPGVADWPTSNVDPTGATVADPNGTCSGGDDAACAWQYGWNRATQDMLWLTADAGPLGVPAAASAYRWWLDVETANSWESGTSGLANNVADLQGMVAAVTDSGGTSGVYSTSSQWGQITGGADSGNLAGLPDWIPGARRLADAKANCALTGFTGTVTVTQWFGHPFDGDYACS